MSYSRLVTWGPPAALLAGAAWMVAAAVAYSGAWRAGPPYGAALAATLAGLAGLHAWQTRGRGGRLGAAGVLGSFVGATLLAVGATLAERPGGGALAAWVLVLGLSVLFVGFVLSGVATLSAGLLPQWCGLLLIVCVPLAGALAGVLGDWGGGVALGLVWLALGWVLATRRDLSALLRSGRR